jgi:hypothetical protein
MGSQKWSLPNLPPRSWSRDTFPHFAGRIFVPSAPHPRECDLLQRTNQEDVGRAGKVCLRACTFQSNGRTPYLESARREKIDRRRERKKCSRDRVQFFTLPVCTIRTRQTSHREFITQDCNCRGFADHHLIALGFEFMWEALSPICASAKEKLACGTRGSK